MPIYEYQCKQCGKVFEYQQRMADDPKTECEECSGALDRIISRSAFHLKGGGWYKDLYASTKPESKAGETGSSSGATPSDSSGSGTADTTSKPSTSTPSTSDSGTSSSASTDSSASASAGTSAGSSSGSSSSD